MLAFCGDQNLIILFNSKQKEINFEYNDDEEESMDTDSKVMNMIMIYVENKSWILFSKIT